MYNHQHKLQHQVYYAQYSKPQGWKSMYDSTCLPFTHHSLSCQLPAGSAQSCSTTNQVSCSNGVSQKAQHAICERDREEEEEGEDGEREGNMEAIVARAQV